MESTSTVGEFSANENVWTPLWRCQQSMDPIVDSLLSSFHQVPPTAIPAMLDCILASTNSAPSSIFSRLLDEFPSFSKGIADGSKDLYFEQHNCVVSFVCAICYLLKKLEEPFGGLERLFGGSFGDGVRTGPTGSVKRSFGSEISGCRLLQLEYFLSLIVLCSPVAYYVLK